MTQPQKRKALTRNQIAQIVLRDGGKCKSCGCKLDFFKPRQVVDEHIVPLFSGGSNETENRAFYCVPCAKEKTSKEAPDRAKVRRLSGQVGSQQQRREKRGGSSIQSRGFSTTHTRGFDGKVRPRKVKA